MRGPASASLQGTANAYLKAATSNDARYAHIDAADKQKVRAELCCHTAKPSSKFPLTAVRQYFRHLLSFGIHPFCFLKI